MTQTEKMASEAIIRCVTREQVKASGPVMRPTSELVAYAHVLERLLHSTWGYPTESLREYIAPHWVDVLIDMEV